MTARVTFAAAFLACALSAGPAAAQSGAASAAAEKLFREGKAFYATGDYAHAIEKFRASQDLEPSVGALLSLGDAYRVRGEVASAWSAYTAARDLAKTKGDARMSDAVQRAAEVSPRLPRLTIRVGSPDTSVTDNGLVLPPASFGSPLPVDPGTHTIVASAKGRRTFRAREVLAEGQSREVVVPELAVDEGARAIMSSPPPERGGAQRTVGTGLLLGGGAVTAAGLLFGALAIGKWHTVTGACPDKRCDSPSARDAAVSDAKTADRFALASTIGVTVGLVALGVGLVLRLTAPSGPPQGTAFAGTLQ